MTDYFVLDWSTPTHLERHVLRAGAAASLHRWKAGQPFSADDEDEDFHPPAKVIALETERPQGSARHVYPEYLSQPLPLLSRRLFAALASANVTSLQTFPTRLTNPRDGAPEDHSLAFNVTRGIEATELQTLTQERERVKRLAALEKLVDGARLFRLDVIEVVVHASVRAQVLASGIDTLTWRAASFDR